MADGRSEPVDPETGVPLSSSAQYADLDLPPRKPREPDFSDDDGASSLAMFCVDYAWGVGLLVGFVGLVLALVTDDYRTDREIITYFFVMGFVGLVTVGAVYLAGRLTMSAEHRSYVVEVRADHERNYRLAVERWRESRPLVWLARQDNPAAALRGLMASQQGSLAIGVVPDTQELYTIKREQPLLVVAAGQLGKTSCLAIPMVMAHQGPAVVTSTKDDLIKATSAVRASRGDVWIFDPAGSWTSRLDPEVNPAYWTPLWSSGDWTSARQTAEAMIRATAIGTGERSFHWRATARMFLASCLFAAALHEDLEMMDVFRWFSRRNFDVPAGILRHVAADPMHPRHGDADLAWESMQAMLWTQGEHADGIITTAVIILEAYNSEHYKAHRGRQNFDPHAFVRSNDTVYIAARSRDQNDFAPVIVAFINAIQQAAYDYEAEAPFHSSQRPSLLMCLDEVANCAPMRDLPRYLSEAGGQGIQIVAFIQSLSQVEEVWPQHVKGFFNFFLNIAAFGGNSDDLTLSALSALTGDFDRQYVSNSFSWTTSKGVSDSRSTSFLNPTTTTTGVNEGSSDTSGQTISFHKERRLTPADIATLPPKHALVISKKERTPRNRGFSILEMVSFLEEPWISVRRSVPVLLPSGVDFGVDQRRPTVAMPPVDELSWSYRVEKKHLARQAAYEEEILDGKEPTQEGPRTDEPKDSQAEG